MTLFARQDNNQANSTLLPPGITPNYVNPDSIGGRIVWAGSFLASLALCFVLMRAYIKLHIIKKWALDDTFIVIAMALAIGRVAVNIYIVKVYMLGRHNWDIPPWEFIRVGNGGKNGMFIGDMMYFMGIMFTKLSILMMYLHIFRIHRWFRWVVYGMMGFVVSYLIIFLFIYAFMCNPVEKAWHLVGWQGGGTCFDMIKVGLVVGGINIFTDVVIFIMPLPLLARLQINNARKLGLMAIFATGIFVLACTIIRQVIMVQKYHDIDQNWNNVQPIVWLTAEFCVGIICACMPSLAPLYTRDLLSTLIPDSVREYLRPLRSWGSSTNMGSRSAEGRSKASQHPLESTPSDVELIDRPFSNQIYHKTNIDVSITKA